MSKEKNHSRARISGAKLKITPEGFRLYLEVEFSKEDGGGQFQHIIDDQAELLSLLQKAGLEDTGQLIQLVGLPCWASIEKDPVFVMGVCAFHGLAEFEDT